jgi:diaminohydroxyphosphoribosylaminopyrimidine deaminase / 5-amino-6-(5-phosphoribosylamino)uracil reductase
MLVVPGQAQNNFNKSIFLILTTMSQDEKYMQRCLDLAYNGIGNVAPNPMVGCVIVKDGEIIGEGFHQQFGKAHAEVNAVNSVRDKNSLKGSTVYVSLEPCAHHGKTPPCADLLIDHKVGEVVIGCKDTFSEVSGRGIEKLKNAGIDVKVGILEKEARHLNRRFFTFHENKRPYIILKWAQTFDGYMDKMRKENAPAHQNRISCDLSIRLVHKWRSEESAIMVGTKTALNDDPQLNVREWTGKQPVRMVIDRSLKLPSNLNLFDNTLRTLIFSEEKEGREDNTEYVKISKSNVPLSICKELYNREIQSLIIEGGRKILESFIVEDLWDEARIITAPEIWNRGISAPGIPGAKLISKENVGEDILFRFENPYRV